MKKLRSFAIGLLLVVTILAAFPFMSASAATPATWTRDNALVVNVRQEAIEAVLEDLEGAFSDLNPACVLIQGLRALGNPGLQLLIVLPESGAAAQQAATALLLDDPRIESVIKCDDVPYESVNTLQLTASPQTIYTGETTSLKPSGELKIFQPRYNNRSIMVTLKEFDPEKQYAPSDFPVVSLKSVSPSGGENLNLELNGQGYDYFALIHAVHALAMDPAIQSVGLEMIVGALRPAEFCKISDPSVAQFAQTKTESYAQDSLVGAANEQGEYILQGLKAGKATVTYYHYGFGGGPYTVSVEITVLDNPPSLSGDADLNGAVNIFDIVVVRNHIFGETALTGQGFANANMGTPADDVLNIFDIKGVRDIIFGG